VVESVIRKTVQLPDTLAATLTRKKVAQQIAPKLEELSPLL